jgi:hypothetical protein
MRVMISSLVVSILSLVATPARAWGEMGHRLVGALAQKLLTPQAQAGVDELLRGEPDPTLAGVAYWADKLRTTDPDRFRATGAWHYVNFSEGSCRFDATRHCKEGACVIGAIETQRRLLADPAQTLEVRRDALKFLVHFVGDVHQPLHSSNRPDRGGNDFPIALPTDIPPEEYARERYKNGLMDTNLHAIWDYYVLASAGLDFATYAQRLAPSVRLPRSSQGGPRAWAAESCRLIDRRSLYPPGHDLDEKYLETMRPLAEQRMRQAAGRLARLLNEVFSGRPGTP